MKRIGNSALIAVILFFTACTSTESEEIASIRNVLEVQVDAWNHGDLGGFMLGYWKNDSLVFTSTKTITYGWENALERYKQRYPSQREMGSLSFSDLSFKLLSDQTALATGQWYLTREDEDFSGRFTLVWKKLNGKWYIVADHSS